MMQMRGSRRFALLAVASTLAPAMSPLPPAQLLAAPAGATQPPRFDPSRMTAESFAAAVEAACGFQPGTALQVRSPRRSSSN
jgi:hypothetical protein